MLDHRVTEQTSTRRLRILKYRGSLHGTNEYPFLIGESGISVLPITSLGLRHSVSTETGVDGRRPPRRDARRRRLLQGQHGPRQRHRRHRQVDAGGAVLRRDLRVAASGRCTSPSRSREAEIVRNMSSVGIDLRQWVDAGLLQFHCFRPSLLGLEAHLFAMQKFVGEFDPAVVVMDPISDLAAASAPAPTCRRC